jgi:hypothetical protein
VFHGMTGRDRDTTLSVGRFSVNVELQSRISTGHSDVQEGQAAVNFFFTSKLDGGILGVQQG